MSDPDDQTDDRPTRPGPIGGDMASIVFGLARRARIPRLVDQHDSTTVMGFFALVNGIISIAVNGPVSRCAPVTGSIHS